MRSNTRLIFLLSLWVISACGISTNRTKVLRLSHSLTETHPVAKAMTIMAKRCDELSGGRLKIKIYPGGQLGGEQQNIEMLQIGSLAMTKVSAAVLEGFAKDYQVLSLPYIFQSKAHYFAVCDGDIGQSILRSSEKKWLKGMCFYDAGFRSFYTKNKMINRPEDLKGLKIRVMQSQTAMEMVNALGGSPTPLSWGELYTALQSNVVDGAENNPPTFVDSRHYEVCKYYSLDEHSSIPDVLIMGLPVWNSLTPDEQKILTQAVAESVVAERKLWKEAEVKALKTLKAAGVEIVHPDKTAFYNKAKTVLAPYEKDPVLGKYIEDIIALKN